MRRTQCLHSVGRPCSNGRPGFLMCRRPHRPRPQLHCRPRRLSVLTPTRCRSPILRPRCCLVRPPGRPRPCTVRAVIERHCPGRSLPRRPCMGDRSGRSPRPPRNRLGRSCLTSPVQCYCCRICVKVAWRLSMPPDPGARSLLL